MRTLSKRQQMLIDMPYSLLKFLIRNKVLSKYLDNISNPDLRTTYGTDGLMQGNPRFHIYHAFLWGTSPEGWEFWIDIKNKYSVYLKWYEKLHKQLRV